MAEVASSSTPKPVVLSSAIRSNSDLKPGESMGGIRLGESFANVLRLLPKKEGTDQITERAKLLISGIEYVCPKNYHSLTLDEDPRGENYYFFDDAEMIFQIASRSERYRLDNKLGVGTKWEEIKEALPVAEEFKVDFVRGPRNEFYLVEKNLGVAFQSLSESEESADIVTMTVVFKPDTEFVPRGCVTPPAQYTRVN